MLYTAQILNIIAIKGGFMLKKLIFGILFSMKANAFYLPAECHWNQYQARCSVFNYQPTPMWCSGKAEGITANGQIVYSYINQVRLLPGMFTYFYIQANPYSPFMRVSGGLHCQY
jgi:hypothetical protein